MFHIGLQTRDIVTFENYQPSTKQNKTKQNKTKQNKTKQNKTKQNKTKQNKTKQNKTKQNKTRTISNNRFKAYQHLPTINNKSNGVFVIEIKD